MKHVLEIAGLGIALTILFALGVVFIVALVLGVVFALAAPLLLALHWVLVALTN